MIHHRTLRVPYAALTIALALGLSSCRSGATVDPSAQTQAPSASALTAELAAKAAAVAPKGRPIRLALAVFTPTQQDYAAKNDFGNFFTEELTGALAKHSARIRLFERSRLEVITKENALTLSGLIDAEQAAKIGQLAPIDYILTGTYTRLGNEVGINVRMLDVVSGEIVFSASPRLALDAGIAGLFIAVVTVNPQTADPAHPLDPCAPPRARITELLADISSDARVAEVVSEAVKVPFDTVCGKVHFKVINAFDRYKKSNADYDRFLMKTLATITAPSSDRRAQEILSYWHRQGPVLADDKFNAGLAAVRKIGDTWLNVYFGYLFHSKGLTDEQVKVQIARLDVCLDLLDKGAIGLPVPVSYGEGFLELVGGLYPLHSTSDARLVLHCYDRAWSKLPALSFDKHHGTLLSVYKREPDAGLSDRLLKFICGNFNAATPDERLGSAMFEFARMLSEYATAPDTAAQARARYARQFDSYRSACGAQLGAALAKTSIRSQRTDVIEFCLKHGIDVPGLIPGVDSLARQLFDDDLNRQREAADFLAVMGQKASPAEQQVIKLFRRSLTMQGSGTTNLRWALISTLGTIGTRNTDAHDLLIQSLESRDYSVPDSAVAALARIGAPVVSALKKVYPSRETYVQIRIVKVFERMGARAKGEIAWLKSQLAVASHAQLRDSLEDAIDRIGR